MADFDSESKEFKKYAKKAATSIVPRIMFFKSFVAQLDFAIDRANSELESKCAETGEARKQIVRLTLARGRRIELGFGETLVCTVALTADHSHIEAVISNERNCPGSPTEQLIAFLLKNNETKTSFESGDHGVRSYRIDLEPLPYGEHEVGAGEMAEGIVAGMLRGRFD
jgi:hypothetical protein